MRLRELTTRTSCMIVVVRGYYVLRNVTDIIFTTSVFLKVAELSYIFLKLFQ